jgi:hypothetical protein
MKLLTFPIRLLFLLILIPLKMILATAGFTFRTGFKAGALPVKGGFAAGRALGLKALVLFAAGVALGVIVGRKLAETDVGLAGVGFPDTPTGPTGVLVEDTIVIEDTVDGPVISETLVVEELDAAEVAAVSDAVDEMVVEAAIDEAVTDELDAEVEAVSELLGETGGDIGDDVGEPTSGADV